MTVFLTVVITMPANGNALRDVMSGTKGLSDILLQFMLEHNVYGVS
jgi:hypothetical protein